jgi:Spy/CpxP family protein refolding chaperone
MVSIVYEEGDRDCGQKHVEQGRHGKRKHLRHGGHCGHYKWQMFQGLNLTSAQKEQMKNMIDNCMEKCSQRRILLGNVVFDQERETEG